MEREITHTSKEGGFGQSSVVSYSSIFHECFKLLKLPKETLRTSLDKRTIHWVGWHKLTKRKEAGGLGLRELELFNQALLAKMAWLF